jgi:hypothetical protein
MRKLKSAGIALAAGICAVGFAGTAEAGGRHGHGGHGGHGHIGHGHGHGHHGHHHGHFGRGVGFGVYLPSYGNDDYYYDDYPDDCYRVWRRGRYRIICED